MEYSVDALNVLVPTRGSADEGAVLPAMAPCPESLHRKRQVDTRRRQNAPQLHPQERVLREAQVGEGRRGHPVPDRHAGPVPGPEAEIMARGERSRREAY